MAPIVRSDRHTVDDAYEAAVGLLDEGVDAIFADNNRMCVGVLRALHDRSASGVGVAGFDDIEFATLLPHPIALVTYDADRLGAHAAELLFARIAGSDAPPKRWTHRTTLVTQAGSATTR